MGGNVKDENEDPEISPLLTNGWSTLGFKVQSIVNTTPFLHYMLGSLGAGKAFLTALVLHDVLAEIGNIQNFEVLNIKPYC